MALNKHIYSTINHTADLGILVYGRNMADLFENAATAMMEILLEPRRLEETDELSISVKAEDLNDLMVRWLSEILYLFMGERRVVTRATLKSIGPSNLDATLHVATYNPDEQEVRNEIKAVTYHQIDVSPKGTEWQAKIFFDV
ncbi:MAG: archease [Deltaproteobacteria bacterium]